MVDVVNLRQHRKRKARDEKSRKAEVNRAAYGRTRSERDETRAQQDMAAKKLTVICARLTTHRRMGHRTFRQQVLKRWMMQPVMRNVLIKKAAPPKPAMMRRVHPVLFGWTHGAAKSILRINRKFRIWGKWTCLLCRQA
tara:strand:- start:323 stop:739 length:417 start_codon:yes stop_codon:yes gene_type:complete